jgi:branched-chain amino acid transport system substrate-binding protein
VKGILTCVMLALLWLGCILLTGCAKKDQEVKVGVIAPLTGDVASYGEWVEKASTLAQEEINAAGGIKGRKLKLVFEDSRAEPRQGVSAIKKLIEVDKVPVVLGGVASSVTLAMAPIAERSKVVLFTPISSNYKISEAGDYIFRLAPADPLQGVIIAEWARDLGYKTGAVLYVNNDYGKGLEDAFTKDFEKLGGKVVSSESYEQSATDFRTQLTKIKAKNPDFIFAPAYPAEAGALLRQRKELGVTTQIIGTDPYHDPTIFDTAGEAANGVMFTDVASGSGPKWEEFRKAYADKYGKDPNIVAAEAYDAVKVTAHVMQKVGFKPDDIKQGLYDLKDYVGATGEIAFDENGDCYTKTFQKFKIENMKYVPLD